MNRFNNPQHQTYIGKRGPEFSGMLSKLLKKGEISQEYIDKLLDKEGLDQFSIAFTHETSHPTRNYELLETLGDQTANKCVLWYFSKRFPSIFCPQGSDIITRIKIKYIQSESFSEISDKLGFWDYISMDMQTRTGNNKDSPKYKILEDVFESFCAVVEILLDKKFGIGTGYSVCFQIISKIMDDMNVSIDYITLNNPISILKEIYDKLISAGIRQKQAEYKIISSISPHHIKVYDNENILGQGQQTLLIGEGKGSNAEIAKQEAAKNAIETLKKEGISKKIPDAYLKFCV